MNKLTTEEVVNKFKKIHKNKYNYELVKYNKSIEKVNIICEKHGIFKITPNSHLNGSGCYECGLEKVGKSKRLTTEDFIKKSNKIHKNRYNYDKAIYTGYLNKLTITCKKHGDFEQKPSKHLQGQNCKKCSNENLYIDFVKKCKKKFGKKYKYEKVNYKGMFNDVIITCKKHGDFKIKPVNFYHKNRGCKKCINHTSSNKESKWLDYMKISKENRNVYMNFKNKTYCVDGINKEKKIIYEFYGDFFHGNPEVYKKNDINPLLKETYGSLYNKTKEKENIILSCGYSIIYIWENDYNKNKNKKKYEKKH